MNNRFKHGDIVSHFKRETVSKNTTKYLYKIIGIVIHSETKEEMMLYQALYDNFSYYVRPLDMFLSLTDKNKYPNIKQNYRFEKIELSEKEKELILKQKPDIEL